MAVNNQHASSGRVLKEDDTHVNIADVLDINSTVGRLTPYDYFGEVALGNVPGRSVIERPCRNENIGTSFEDLWTFGGTKIYPSAETTLTIVSDSANDTAGGTGARTIQVMYLDGDYVMQSPIITMNGTTPITTITDCFRFDSAVILTSGSGDGADGTISFSTDGNEQGEILPTRTITNTSQFTVPAGKTYLIRSIVFSVERGDRIRFELEKRDIESGRDFRTDDYFFIYQNTRVVNPDLPLGVIPEKHDFRIRVQAESTASLAFADIQIEAVDNG